MNTKFILVGHQFVNKHRCRYNLKTWQTWKALEGEKLEIEQIKVLHFLGTSHSAKTIIALRAFGEFWPNALEHIYVILFNCLQA